MEAAPSLLIGLWRYRRGGGTLFFEVAASVFVLVHLPFNPVEWFVTVFALPLAIAAAGFLAWRERR